MFNNSAVTLNIESNEIRYLVVNGKHIHSWGSVPLPQGLVKQNLIADSAELSSIINGLFIEKKLPKSVIIASMTGLRSVLRTFRLPKLKPGLQEEAIRHEAEREMPVPLEELYLSKQLITSNGADQRFLVLGVPREILDTEVNTLTNAGIRPDIINLKPIALTRAVNRSDAIIIDLEAETLDLVVVVGGIPAIMRTVISRGDGLLLEDRIPQLKDELARTVEFYNGNHPDLPLNPETPVFLTGQLSDNSTTLELIQTAVSNPVEPLSPPGKFPPDFPIGQYAVNIGLARQRSSSKHNASIPVVNPNILVHRYEARHVSPVKALYPILAVGLAALMFFVYQWKSNIEAEIAGPNDELVTVNLQIDDMRETAARTAAVIKNVESETIVLRETIESIKAVLATSNFSVSLKPALDAIPGGVQITAVNQLPDQLSLDGQAEEESVVAQYVLALERTGLFSRVYVSPLLGGGSESLVDFTVTCDIDAGN
jgi:type IV pilus assembly protein PilM